MQKMNRHGMKIPHTLKSNLSVYWIMLNGINPAYFLNRNMDLGPIVNPLLNLIKWCILSSIRNSAWWCYFQFLHLEKEWIYYTILNDIFGQNIPSRLGGENFRPPRLQSRWARLVCRYDLEIPPRVKRIVSAGFPVHKYMTFTHFSFFAPEP